ncbi:fungal-specific transcription factor [Coniochaeta sp. 2T2.1]|nr:fungal-specific transcription factor [Coniochaeta sp. 2T2.1]
MSKPSLASSSDGKSAAAQDIGTTPRPRPPTGRRREKPQLSCTLCRRRKSRCDRQQPCSVCSARGLECTYIDVPPSLMPKMPSAVPSMHDRLAQLERLVLSMKSSSGLGSIHASALPSSTTSKPSILASETPSEPDYTPADIQSECGSIRLTTSESTYVGGDHWVAILDSIADLKDHFDRERHLEMEDDLDFSNQEDSGVPRSRHALLLYGPNQPSSRTEILAALPPKTAVDRYVSRYFNRLDSLAVSIHGPSFLRAYESFWADSSTLPIAWIGLLFSIICLAVLVSDTTDLPSQDASQHNLQVDLYREKTVQCLFAAEYTKPGPYVLETMTHYLYIEFVLHADANKDVWYLLSLAVNMAKRMGYHRDPSHFRGISPLQAELRRRLWSKVLMSDIIVSSQMGMPRMVSESEHDAAEPRNLSDSDLDGLEDNAELPSPRPETEYTPTLNQIARRRILIALGKVLDLTTAVKPATHAEVMAIDTTLHTAAARISPPLKPKSMAASVTDPPQQIFARLFLQHLLYKGQIMLHRRFLSLSNTQISPDLSYSRSSVLDASLGTLDIQQLLDEEIQPGGVLYTMRYRVTSSMNHLFLTATVILCSMLDKKQTLGREEDILSALKRTRAIWLRKSGTSKEAKKAAETVSIVLAKHGGQHGGIKIDDTAQGTTTYDLESDSRGGLGLLTQRDVESEGLSGLGPREQPFDFSMADGNMGAEMDDWMMMNASGTGWM